MKKFILGMVALMTLFAISNVSAQDAQGCGIPAASIDPASPATYFTVPNNSTGGQSVEFTEDTLLETVTYEFQFSDLAGTANFADIQIGTLTSGPFGLSFGALETSPTFAIPTSGSGDSPIITTDFSASNLTLTAGQEYWIRVRGKATAGGLIGESFQLRNSQSNGYADGSFYRTLSGVDVGIGDQSVDVFLSVVASGIEAPTNVASTSVTDTTADFSWDSQTDTTYEAKVIADGGDPDVDADLGSTMVTGATASASGLTASTSYDFYVRATGTCGGTAYESDWVLVDFMTIATGDNCNIIDGATIGATDIAMTTATITFTPAASGADGSVPNTAQILVFRTSDNTVDFNSSGVDVSQTSGGTVAVTGLIAGTEYNVRFLNQTCSGTTTIPDGGSPITTVNGVFTTLADPVQIVVDSSVAGTLTEMELTDAGVTQTGLTPAEITAIQTAVVAAMPAPTTTAELQAIVDAALEELAVAVVVSSSGGGTLTEMELTAAGVTQTGLTPAEIAAIQAAVVAAAPAPTNTAELQAIVDTALEEAAVAVVVSSSGGGTLTEMELTDAGVTQTGLTPAEIAAIEDAVNAAMPAPTTTAELQAIVDAAVAEVAAVAVVVSSSGGGTLTEQELTDAGVTQTGLTPEEIAAIEDAVNAAMPAPTTPEELQAIVDAAVAEVAAVAVVVSSSGGGTLTEQELTDAGVTQTGLTPEEIAAIEDAVNAAMPAPTTPEELQAIVDTAVAEVAAVAIVVSSSGGGTLTEQELTDAGVTQTGLTPEEIAVIEDAVNAAMPAPTTPEELQAIVDAAIAEVAAVAVVVSSSGSGTLTQQELTDAGITQTGLTPEQIDAIELGVSSAAPAPITTAELQAIVDASLNLLGFDDLSADSFYIYPNPGTDIVKITIEVEKVMMYSITGQKVLETDANTLDVSMLETGMYFIEINTTKGNAIKRFMKE